MKRPGKFPMLSPSSPVGPWETKRFGPLVMRVRRKDRYEVERRRLRRASAIFAERFTEGIGIYWLLDHLTDDRLAAARKVLRRMTRRML